MSLNQVYPYYSSVSILKKNVAWDDFIAQLTFFFLKTENLIPRVVATLLRHLSHYVTMQFSSQQPTVNK